MTYIHVEEGRTAVNEERVRVRLIEGFGSPWSSLC